MAINTYVDHFAKIGTVTTQDVTIGVDLTSGVHAIYLWGSGSDQASGTWDAGIGAVQGFVSINNGTIVEYSVGITSDDGTAANTARRMAAKCLTLPTTSGGGTQWEANVTVLNATTLRFNWTANAGGTETINYQIVTGLTGAKVLQWAEPSTAINQAVTGAGFKPDLVFHASALNTAATFSSTDAYFSFGMMNKFGQQGANAICGQDTAGTSNTSRWQQTDACLLNVATTENPLVQAQFVSMDADGFTVNFSNANAAYYVISLCMAGVSSKIGTFVGATGPQAVPSRHGFTTSGALFTGVGDSPESAPATNTCFTLGATDGNNQRVAQFFDRDALGTTRVKAEWRNDCSIAINDLAASPTTYDRGSVAFTDSTSFTVTWTNLSAGNEYLYCLIGGAGTTTTPSTTLDTATTNAVATGYSNQKHGCTLSIGRHVRVIAETTTNARFEWSDGTFAPYDTTDFEADIGGWSNGSISEPYIDSGGIERLLVSWSQSGTSGTGPTGGARTDLNVYAAIGTFNAGRTTLTWGAAVLIWNASTINYPDIVCHSEGTGGYAHIVTSQVTSTPGNFVNYKAVSIDSSGVGTAGSPTDLNTSYAVGVDTWPSICLDPATNNLHVAWSAGTSGAGKGIRYRKSNTTTGSRTFATEVEVDNARYINATYGSVQARWNNHDSMLVILAGAVYNVTTYDTYQYETTNFTSFSASRALLTGYAATGAVGTFWPSLAIDPTTGDSYIIHQNANAVDIGYYKWTRVTTTLGSRVVTDSSGDGGGASVHFPFAWFSNNSVRWVYTRGNNNPLGSSYDFLDLRWFLPGIRRLQAVTRASSY